MMLKACLMGIFPYNNIEHVDVPVVFFYILKGTLNEQQKWGSAMSIMQVMSLTVFALSNLFGWIGICWMLAYKIMRETTTQFDCQAPREHTTGNDWEFAVPKW